MTQYRRFKIGKLVRDGIPQIMTEQGIKTHNYELDAEGWFKSLKTKLLEEAEEVRTSSSTDELLEELADVIEVIYHLGKSKGFTPEQIEQRRALKNALKGGFENKTYLDYFDIAEESPVFERYKAKPSIATNSCLNCVFCETILNENEHTVLAKFKHCYAIADNFPVSKGHLLIIPIQHIDNWFAASEEIQQDMIHALNQMKQRLEKEHGPDGYNIGINCGSAAGQSVMHLHLHLIPRYSGDMDNPRGGIRGVIPSKQKY